jgi:hypothetical protein
MFILNYYSNESENKHYHKQLMLYSIKEQTLMHQERHEMIESLTYSMSHINCVCHHCIKPYSML